MVAQRLLEAKYPLVAKLAPLQKRAIIFGSERTGLSEQALACADACVKIAMNPNVDSLNVAAAAAISCYALR